MYCWNHAVTNFATSVKLTFDKSNELKECSLLEYQRQKNNIPACYMNLSFYLLFAHKDRMIDEKKKGRILLYRNMS